jgi:ribosomal protein S18 acetylase RimI-like enzyme
MQTTDWTLMKIHQSTLSSVAEFRNFWAAALAYQAAAQLPAWSPYPEEKINNEIAAGLHFSAFMPDGVLAGFFSVVLSDAMIWGSKEKGDAIYLHRMCVNPACRGKYLAASVLTWAYGYASGRGRKFVRMDTWGDNPRLVNHYVACGFQHIGNRQMGQAPDLLPHYKNANLALFENEVAPA